MTATLSRPSDPTQSADDRSTTDRTGDTQQDVRRTLLAFLASALGVFPLCDLFTDRGWLIDVWLSMAIVVAPAAILRRRRPASAGQIWIGVALLVPWLTVNFVRSHAVLGVLPFAGAWHDVGRLMTDLHSTTTDQVAPVHTTVAIRLAVCALLGLIAALVDLLAVVGRRGALAGVPLLVVFTISGAVPRKPVSWLFFTLAAAGFLILLALDSSDDLQRWGHYVPRANRAARRRAAGAVSGQRIAAAAIVAAVVLPFFIPANSRNFVANLFHPDRGTNADSFGADSVGVGSGTGGIDPFAALRGELKRDRKVDLLTVRIHSDDPSFGTAKGTQPFYLRTNVLPIYTGSGWRPGADGTLQDLDDTEYASSPGTAFEPRVVRYSADITVSGLRSNPPLFATPTALSGLDSDTKWSPKNQLLIGSRVTGGQTIQEDVAQPQPSTADLNAATASDPALASWLTLPTISPYVRALTTSVLGKATTPYQKARAISNFFADPKEGFAYSLQTSNGDSGDDLTDFLKNRVGYCQQYAAAMAVMLRLAKVPARVVLGYAHDVPDSNGSFTVTTYDAHAWVEAYFSGIGWVPFDPTPILGISGGSTNDLSWAPHIVPKSSLPTAPVATPTITHATRPTGETTAPAASSARADHGSWGIGLAALVLVVVVVVVLLTPAFVRWRRRRHHLHQARNGDTDALWAELSDTATDLGYVWSSARTPRQVASWLGGSSAKADSSLHTLTAAVERARYAPAAAAAGPQLVHDLTAVEAGLRLRRTSRERLRAIFWPASLGWSRVPLIGPWLPGNAGARRR